MLEIDKSISDTNAVICDNIARFDVSERGLLSQNILAQLRNFVEYVAIKIYSENKTKYLNPSVYANHKESLGYIKHCGQFYFIRDFHEMLQQSVSHYTVDKDSSERLMLKYYEYLLRIKQYLKQRFNIDVLENIEQFPLNMDTELSDYYKKIVEKIQSPSKYRKHVTYSDRYYIQKIKPFFVEQQIYYEVTFTAANTKASKFDRIIAFTKHDIFDNYAVKLSIYTDIIHILEKEMSILVIDNYEISIRPCEFHNFAKIFGYQTRYKATSNEYKKLMHIIREKRISLTDLVESEQKYYDDIKRLIIEDEKGDIYNILDRCRKIISDNAPGANILRYLLHKMNNRIIKTQYKNQPCEKLSNLYLHYGCIPFEEMPYCTSLYQHNPRIKDLIESIPTSDREHELFIRYIKNTTEIEENLFIKKDQIKGFKYIDTLIQKYNAALYDKHINRRVEEHNGFLYIKGYVDDCIGIINKLQELASSGISQYTASVDSWLHNEAYDIDDKNKKEALRNMFEQSRVALIYGSAGTGKSTLIKHIANFFADKNKIFLANTHPAVDNMRRKIRTAHSEYSTIAKFISNKNYQRCDILFIDECSTISNSDMQKILQKSNFQLLILVGDIYQIESIYFGNWFSIAPKFVPETSIFQLTNPFRSKNEELLKVWKDVRSCKTTILESLVGNGYVSRLDNSIFEKENDDEIILCLNYDGLYGINNINRYIQNNNPNKSIIWGTHTYKIGDPILFNESNRFAPLIHNNSKGRIIDIQPEDQQISFDIELDESINALDAADYDFSLIGESKSGKSIIRFYVNKYRETDEDDDDSTVVPFQVAYAVSIHKAQGLEYDSVKIVITNEIEEQISHNIFYTAITRAKNKLKIYWSPETERLVLNSLKRKEPDADANRLSAFFSVPIKNNIKISNILL